MEESYQRLMEQLAKLEKKLEEEEKLYNCKGPDTIQ